MKEHICFESIDCKDLEYVKQGSCWVCMQMFYDVGDVDFCMQCRFSKKETEERRKYGKWTPRKKTSVLRLA